MTAQDAIDAGLTADDACAHCERAAQTVRG